VLRLGGPASALVAPLRPARRRSCNARDGGVVRRGRDPAPALGCPAGGVLMRLASELARVDDYREFGRAATPLAVSAPGAGDCPILCVFGVV